MVVQTQCLRILVRRNLIRRNNSTIHCFAGQQSSSSSSSSSFSKNTSSKPIKTIDIGNDTKLHRPYKWWERLYHFPRNVTHLMEDIHRNTNIKNAVWKNGIIPRQQIEQQRMLRHDIRIALPLVILSIPPIIGYIPVLMAIISPRQWMSRHFFNNHERLLNASIEVEQRRQHSTDLSQSLFQLLNMKHTNIPHHFSNKDLVGPILDLVPLYQQWDKTLHASDRILSVRHHLVLLATMSGYLQRFPPILADPIRSILPSAWLRADILQHSDELCRDDDLLIQEGYDIMACNIMTNDEVVEACWLRGLPIGIISTTGIGNYTAMREQLTMHLIMMKELRNKIGTNRQHLPLLTLHVTALRYHCMSDPSREQSTL